jgi:hypothetical protein
VPPKQATDGKNVKDYLSLLLLHPQSGWLRAIIELSVLSQAKQTAFLSPLMPVIMPLSSQANCRHSRPGALAVITSVSDASDHDPMPLPSQANCRNSRPGALAGQEMAALPVCQQYGHAL